MNKSVILRERKTLLHLSGKAEFFFFTSGFLSAGVLSAILGIFTAQIFKRPSGAAVYSSLIDKASGVFKTSAATPDVLKEIIPAAGSVFREILLLLPGAAALFLALLLIVCPIYQGTIRWCAYLSEERHPLPIRAVLFYFLSPRLYFGSLLLSLRLLIRRLLFLILFIFPSAICLSLSFVLGSDYYGATAASSAALILSAVWLTLSCVLYLIFIRRYDAVRYLYAIGESKKIFKKSVRITGGRRAWLFTLRLRLLLNLPLAFTVALAPYAASRAISGMALCVRALIADKKKTA